MIAKSKADKKRFRLVGSGSVGCSSTSSVIGQYSSSSSTAILRSSSRVQERPVNAKHLQPTPLKRLDLKRVLEQSLPVNSCLQNLSASMVDVQFSFGFQN